MNRSAFRISSCDLLPQARRWTLASSLPLLLVASACASLEPQAEPVIDIATVYGLDSITSGDSCTGPNVVLYTLLPSDQIAEQFGAGEEEQLKPAEEERRWSAEIFAEEVQRSEIVFPGFLSSAQELQGIACFHLMSCWDWPDSCLDQNIGRTPTIILYPPEGLPARMIEHRVPDERRITGEIVKLLGAQTDRTVAVNSENIQGFLHHRGKPLKAILFSNRKTVPVTWQVLSNDVDLWAHTLFGFARDTDTALKNMFGVTKVPTVVIQLGSNESTRAALHGMDTAPGSAIGVLRAWLTSRVAEHVIELERDWDAYVARSLAIAKQDAIEEATAAAMAAKFAVKYQKLARGSNGCPRGLEITSSQECQIAIISLGMDPTPLWVSVYPGVPRWCSLREEPGDNSQERMHFNSAAEGTGRDDLAPICKVENPDAAAAARSSQKAPQQKQMPAQPVPSSGAKESAPAPRQSSGKAEVYRLDEVTDDSAPQVLKAPATSIEPKYHFLYMSNGRMTPEETKMVERLAVAYTKPASDQAKTVHWNWVDATANPRLKDTFRPPTLPSAVMVQIRPRRTQRFALVKHRLHPDGHYAPATKEDLDSLMLSVLSNTVRFLTVEGAQQAASMQGASKRIREAGWQGTRYELLPRGTDACPEGLEVRTAEECEYALTQLGIKIYPKWVSVYPGLPRWCSVRERTTEGDKEYMHFNGAETGTGREDLSPVCKVDARMQSINEAERAKLPIPELTGSSYPELFGSTGLCFVYMTEGALTLKEADTIMAIAERFTPRLQEKGETMRWMWLDLRIERRLRQNLDPPALPSAMVLNPHPRPRFVMANHEEGDDDWRPVDEDSMQLLLNKVLGGDAQFTSIQSFKLHVWTDRSA